MNELELLPQEQKEVYLLREYSGLSYKEIADIQQIDEELVKSRLFKTRQKLIKKVSKLV
jgi:RNA polymerase sigma-70 factor (ECF subfamily)